MTAPDRSTPPGTLGFHPGGPARRPVPVAAPLTRSEPLLRHLLGEVLRAEREEQARTLREVADTARISMAYLSEIERGRKEPSSEVLAAVCRALGLDLADLLGRAHWELLLAAGDGTVVSLAPLRGRAGPAASIAGALALTG